MTCPVSGLYSKMISLHTDGVLWFDQLFQCWWFYCRQRFSSHEDGLGKSHSSCIHIACVGAQPHLPNLVLPCSVHFQYLGWGSKWLQYLCSSGLEAASCWKVSCMEPWAVVPIWLISSLFVRHLIKRFLSECAYRFYSRNLRKIIGKSRFLFHNVQLLSFFSWNAQLFIVDTPARQLSKVWVCFGLKYYLKHR